MTQSRAFLPFLLGICQKIYAYLVNRGDGKQSGLRTGPLDVLLTYSNILESATEGDFVFFKC